MRKRLLLSVAALAATLCTVPAFAQDATETPMPMDDMAMQDMSAMRMSHIRIAYMVSDGPAVDIYVNGTMGMMDGMDSMMEGAMDSMTEGMDSAMAGMDSVMEGADSMMEGMDSMVEGAMDSMTEGMDSAMGGMMMGEGMGMLITTLTTGTITDFLAAPAGSYSVTITAQGDMAPVFGPIPVSLMGGEYLSVVVIGSVANNTVELVLVDEPLSTYTTGGATVTVFNAIEGSPAVDVVTADGIPLVTGLTYAGRGMMGEDMATEEAQTDDDMMAMSMFATDTSSQTVLVPAEFTGATYDIRVVNQGDGAELAAFDGVAIDADTAYFIVAYSLDGATAQLAINTANLTEITAMDMMGMDSMGEDSMMEATAEATPAS